MKGCSFKMNIYIQNHIIQETDAHMTRHIVYGEIALIVAVCINSFAVVLMLYSGAGISAISSVPYAFSEVLPKLSLGTWTYIFQGLLVLTLMILRKKFVPQYLCSFIVGFSSGNCLMSMKCGSTFFQPLSDTGFFIL